LSSDQHFDGTVFVQAGGGSVFSPVKPINGIKNYFE